MSINESSESDFPAILEGRNRKYLFFRRSKILEMDRNSPLNFYGTFLQRNEVQFKILKTVLFILLVKSKKENGL